MTTGYATRERIATAAKSVVLPPPSPLSHSEFCRTLVIPDGTLRGARYVPDNDPVHAALCREIDRGGWQRIIGVGAVQTGKSLALILVPILRNLTLLRQPVVYSQPTLTKLHEGWAGKLAPSIRDSGYGGWLPTDGQGAKGSQTPKFLTFRDPKSRARAGTLYLIPGGGASESAQAAVTAAVVCVDEIDSFQDRHRVELVTKRADSYGPRGLRIYTSTVKSDTSEGPEASIILALYNESTASRLWFSCPHCNHWQAIEWERVSYDEENEPAAIASARYACSGCAVAWSEDDRQRALRSWRIVHKGQQVDQATGTVVGTAPLTVAFGLLWSALDSSLRSLGQVAAEHWRATRAVALGDHGPMRSFFRDQLCRPYLADKAGEDGIPAQITRAYLSARSGSSHYGPARGERQEDGDSTHASDCPAEVDFLTATVDVQRGGQRAPGRLYYLVTGWNGSDGRSFDLAWGHLILAPAGVQPTTGELHGGLDRMHAVLNGLAAEWGRPLPRRGVDVGDRQEEIRLWLTKQPDWWAIKGASGTVRADLKASLGFDLAGSIYRREQQERSGRWWLHIIDTDQCRREAQAGFRVPSGKPGAAHLPKGLVVADTLLRHYCATCEVPDGRGGSRWSDREKDRVHHPEYQLRHDLLDCRTYAVALARQYIRTLNQPRHVRKYGNLGSING